MMHRLFVALRPPPPIRAGLSGAMGGIPQARWQDDDQLHLTLRFVGEVASRQAEDIATALESIAAPAPRVRIDGVGRFASGGRANAIWAGVTPHDALAHLHRKVDRALGAAGVAPDGRAFLPHVTLARLPRRAAGDPSVERWLAGHAALASPPFAMPHLMLYESRLASDGARYEAVARWPLSAPGGQD